MGGLLGHVGITFNCWALLKETVDVDEVARINFGELAVFVVVVQDTADQTVVPSASHDSSKRVTLAMIQ